jgi:hypothetical protein
MGNAVTLSTKPFAPRTPKPPANSIIPTVFFTNFPSLSLNIYIRGTSSTISFIKQAHILLGSISSVTQSLCREDESNKQSICGSKCWSCGGHERPAGDLQVESCLKISAAECKETSQVLLSGQQPFSFNFCNGFKQSKRAESEAVGGVFEDGHVLELLGSQLSR